VSQLTCPHAFDGASEEHAGGGVPLLPEHALQEPVRPHDCVPQSLQLRVTATLPTQVPHDPSLAHVSVPQSPHSRVWPGTQLPQFALMQAIEHAEPLDCQLPVASQICGCMPEHRTCPGVQPTHAPLTHPCWHAEP